LLIRQPADKQKIGIKKPFAYRERVFILSSEERVGESTRAQRPSRSQIKVILILSSEERVGERMLSRAASERRQNIGQYRAVLTYI
jgi:hypothetical protein